MSSDDDFAGWITPLAARVSRSVGALSYRIMRRPPAGPHFAAPAHTSPDSVKKVDTYVALLGLADIAAYASAFLFHQGWGGWPGIAWCCARIVDILAQTLNNSVFYRIGRMRRIPAIASPERVVVLSLINFLELIVC